MPLVPTGPASRLRERTHGRARPHEAVGLSRSTFFRYVGTKEDVVLFDDVDSVMDRMMAAIPGDAAARRVRSVLRDSFASLDDEARALEEVGMEPARSAPQIAAILRERNAFGVEEVAEMVGLAMLGRLPAGVPLADEPVRAPGRITSHSS